MINHKIFDTLKSFDENYLKRLRDFINSPYFNSNKKVKELFEIIYFKILNPIIMMQKKHPPKGDNKGGGGGGNKRRPRPANKPPQG